MYIGRGPHGSGSTFARSSLLVCSTVGPDGVVGGTLLAPMLIISESRSTSGTERLLGWWGCGVTCWITVNSTSIVRSVPGFHACLIAPTTSLVLLPTGTLLISFTTIPSWKPAMYAGESCSTRMTFGPLTVMPTLTCGTFFTKRFAVRVTVVGLALRSLVFSRIDGPCFETRSFSDCFRVCKCNRGHFFPCCTFGQPCVVLKASQRLIESTRTLHCPSHSLHLRKTCPFFVRTLSQLLCWHGSAS